jgi:hypothetical protein
MNGDYLNAVLIKYKSKGVLIDSNLLLLYFVGQHDPTQIGGFKRTRAYTVDDYVLLRHLLGLVSPIVTTPNISTEVSNLSGQMPEVLKRGYFDRFRSEVHVLAETYMPSAQASESPYLARLGLTDSVIADISKDKYLVLTDDFPLSNLLQKLRIDVINFNHVRGWYTFSV